MTIDEKYIKRCIQLSKEALKSGDQPFGSIIVKRNRILAEAKNNIKKLGFTAHAEIIAIKEVERTRKPNDFSDLTIYTNCEPCPMCAFMIRVLKFKKVVFAIESPLMGGFSRWNILNDKKLAKLKPAFSDPPKIVKGVLREKAKEVFDEIGWFKMFNRC